MIAADRATQRPAGARLLVIDAAGRITETLRSRWLDYLRAGDAVIANDAATLPASLAGVHARTRAQIEVRLAAWRTQSDAITFDAIVFGAGDFRTRTEDRPPPPALAVADTLVLGPLTATIDRVLDHPRLVRLRFDATAAAFWQGLAAHGRPIQYAHLREPLALWDAWTAIAAAPVAFEPPSAGFVLDWQTVAAMQSRGIRFATLTHAAGVSSTGDAALDRRLPLDEPYRIADATVRLVLQTCADRGRVIAVGTTVARALEHAASQPAGLRPGDGLATQRIGPTTELRIVDAIVTGTHEPGSSHHELLGAFARPEVLSHADVALERLGFRTHEYGDSLLVFRGLRAASVRSR